MIVYLVRKIRDKKKVSATGAPPEAVRHIEKLTKGKSVFIATKRDDTPSNEVKDIIASITKEAHITELDVIGHGYELEAALEDLTGEKAVPYVFIGGEYIGGYAEVQDLNSKGKLAPKIQAAL